LAPGFLLPLSGTSELLDGEDDIRLILLEAFR
jgi:hypothetical protein